MRYSYADSDGQPHSGVMHLYGFAEAHDEIMQLFEKRTGTSDQSELNDVRPGEGGSSGSSTDAAAMPSLPTEKVGSTRSLVIAAVIASILFMAGAFAVMVRAIFFASARNTGSTSLNSASRKSAI